jgi:hypothetical protein
VVYAGYLLRENMVAFRHYPQFVSGGTVRVNHTPGSIYAAFSQFNNQFSARFVVTNCT